MLCGSEGTADFVLNIALFMPLGVGLWLAGVRPAAAWAVSAAVTVSVEGLQYALIAGRDASLGDLVANALGGGAGYVLATNWRAILRPDLHLARRLLLGSSGMVAAILGLSAWALRPSLPSGTWYGQWAISGPEEEWFDGMVVRAELGAEPLTHWRLQDSRERRERLKGQPIRLWAKIVSGRPQEAPLRIISVAVDSARFIALSAAGGDLRFGVQVRGRDLRLRSPTFRLAGALPERAGVPAEVEGSVWQGTVSVGARHEGEARQNFRPTALDGWMLLLPWDVRGGPQTLALRLAWGLCLFGPLGWWAARARRGRPSPGLSPSLRSG
jgi:hypothetical protein